MLKQADGVSDVIDITIDRNRISNYFKGTVNVSSDRPFTAIEARATRTGSAFGKGTGLCLLSDDDATATGVVTFSSAVNSYSFDIECSEIITDGDYRISVYIRTEDGKWNDAAVFQTSSSETVVTSDGYRILVKRNSSGTDETYTSAYTGKNINNFISEVLS